MENSPLICGLNPDLSVYRFKLKDMLDTGDCEVADGTCRDSPTLTPDCFRNPKQKQQMAEDRAFTFATLVTKIAMLWR